MLEKNQIYEATITDYTTEGQGIAHIDGKDHITLPFLFFRQRSV